MKSTTSKPAKLDVFTFGRRLIETRDLDPVYDLLWAAKLPREVLCDALVAYWCFYHWGTVSWILEGGGTVRLGRKDDGQAYWDRMAAAAETSEHPRGTERRHFRGYNATSAIEELRSRGESCLELVGGLITQGEDGLPPTLSTVVSRVMRFRGFGPWIGFKVADMLERLDLCPVRFRPSDIFNMYDTPRKGAEILASQLGGPEPPYLWAYNRIGRELRTLKAPPRFERPINIQEIETILCKWKSHLGGHYDVGKDTREIHHGLVKYKNCSFAKRLLRAGVSIKLWKE